MVTSFKYKNSYCKGQLRFKSIKPSAKKTFGWGSVELLGGWLWVQVPAEAGQGHQGLSMPWYLIPSRPSVGVV